MRAGDRYDPHTIADLMLMFADNFAQTAPNAISHHGRTNRSRSHKPGSESIAGRDCKYAQNKKLSALSASTPSHLVEFCRFDQPS